MRKILDDVPTFSPENISKQAESMVGSYRTESTDQWTAASWITTKTPPFFNGSTSGFKYEELIDDWLDLTVLEAEKRGRALKNRLVRDAEMYKELLNRESLRAENGVKYFKDTLWLHFMKGAQSVFFWRFYRFSNARMGNIANSLMDQLRTVFPQTFLRSPQCLTAHVQPQSALSTSCPKQ